MAPGFQKLLLFMCLSVFCLYVCLGTICIQCLQRSEEASEALELELEKLVSCHVGDGD